jgi:hypothetical protein
MVSVYMISASKWDYVFPGYYKVLSICGWLVSGMSSSTLADLDVVDPYYTYMAFTFYSSRGCREALSRIGSDVILVS